MFRRKELDHYIAMKNYIVERRRLEVESTMQLLADRTDNLAVMKEELEKEAGKIHKDENRIKTLLWWIYNTEELIKQTKDELIKKENDLNSAMEDLILEQHLDYVGNNDINS